MGSSLLLTNSYIGLYVLYHSIFNGAIVDLTPFVPGRTDKDRFAKKGAKNSQGREWALKSSSEGLRNFLRV